MDEHERQRARSAETDTELTAVEANGAPREAGMTARTASEPSRSLAQDRYSFTERLGEGATATVFAAVDSRLGRTVAVKTLRQEHLGNERVRGRFEDEARFVAAIDHPGVVPIFEAGLLADGTPFQAMKRVRGRTLRELLAARTTAELRSRESLLHFVAYFEHVCQAIAAAHADDLIHRDLKPDNVMVDELGAVYVMDWGLAKKVRLVRALGDAERTHLGDLMGTPAYMSPELMRGEAFEAGPETDVFSLGVILFEILTGTKPFAADSFKELGEKIRHADPPSPRRLNRSVPPELSAICLKALDKNTMRRYRNAGQLAADIRAYFELAPISAFQPSVLRRIARWARRRPAVAAAASTLALVALLGGAYVSVGSATRRVMVSEGLRQVNELEASLARVDGQIASMQTRLDTLPASAGERASAEIEHRRLLASRSLLAERLVATFSWLLAQDPARPDPELQRRARERILAGIDESVAASDPFRAGATIGWLLESAARHNPLGLSDSDVERLQRTLETIEASPGMTPTR